MLVLCLCVNLSHQSINLFLSIHTCADLSKFGMEVLETDTVSLMRKRVYDLAGVLGRTCKVRGMGLHCVLLCPLSESSQCACFTDQQSSHPLSYHSLPME